MKHVILRWSVALTLSLSVVGFGCSKAEKDGAKAEETASPEQPGSQNDTAVDKKSEVAPPATRGGDGKGGADDATRHEKMVENAKNAIPTVASDDQTNAAVAKSNGDEQLGGKEAVAANQELAKAAKAMPAATSTLADTSTYTVVVDAPTGAAGKDSKLVISVKPKKGWKLNMEFPTKLKVEPPAGVTVAKSTLKKGDAKVFSEKKGAEWSIGYKSSSSGKKSFSGKLKFAVCTDATCDPKSETLAFAVDVK